MKRIRKKKRVADAKRLVQTVVPVGLADWLGAAARMEGLSVAAFVRRELMELQRRLGAVTDPANMRRARSV